MDLLERPADYIVWAAAMDGANVRTMSRSDAARYASVADGCKQRCESPQSEQEERHGETVVRSQKRGYEFECMHCGSPHGVEQDHGTLTAARLSGGEVAADGGTERGPHEARSEQELASAWPSATEAARVGEAPGEAERRELVRQAVEQMDEPTVAAVAGRVARHGIEPPEVAGYLADLTDGTAPGEVVSMSRPPDWRVVSVSVGEEEYPASSGNGVEMVEIDHGAQDRVARALRREGGEGARWRCECGVCGYGSAMASHLAVRHGVGDAEVALSVAGRETAGEVS
jgi:hypothetical protein